MTRREWLPTRTTATFGALRLYIDNWRWQGVPFYLRSGKLLATKASEITVQFKDVPLKLFPSRDGAGPHANFISMCIQPDEGMHLRFETKIPGMGMRMRSVEMDFSFGEEFGESALPEAYERLLLDALTGDPSLFARSDEIELSWARGGSDHRRLGRGSSAATRLLRERHLGTPGVGTAARGGRSPLAHRVRQPVRGDQGVNHRRLPAKITRARADTRALFVTDLLLSPPFLAHQIADNRDLHFMALVGPQGVVQCQAVRQ